MPRARRPSCVGLRSSTSGLDGDVLAGLEVGGRLEELVLEAVEQVYRHGARLVDDGVCTPRLEVTRPHDVEGGVQAVAEEAPALQPSGDGLEDRRNAGASRVGTRSLDGTGRHVRCWASASRHRISRSSSTRTPRLSAARACRAAIAVVIRSAAASRASASSAPSASMSDCERSRMASTRSNGSLRRTVATSRCPSPKVSGVRNPLDGPDLSSLEHGFDARGRV